MKAGALRELSIRATPSTLVPDTSRRTESCLGWSEPKLSGTWTNRVRHPEEDTVPGVVSRDIFYAHAVLCERHLGHPTPDSVFPFGLETHDTRAAELFCSRHRQPRFRPFTLSRAFSSPFALVSWCHRGACSARDRSLDLRVPRLCPPSLRSGPRGVDDAPHLTHGCRRW